MEKLWREWKVCSVSRVPAVCGMLKRVIVPVFHCVGEVGLLSGYSQQWLLMQSVVLSVVC